MTALGRIREQQTISLSQLHDLSVGRDMDRTIEKLERIKSLATGNDLSDNREAAKAAMRAFADGLIEMADTLAYLEDGSEIRDIDRKDIRNAVHDCFIDVIGTGDE